MMQGTTLTSFAAVLALSLLLPATAEAARDQNVTKAAERLAGEFKSRMMKDAVAEAHEQLWSPDPAQYDDAILFFAELKAKPMLFAILNSRLMGGHLGFGGTELTFLAELVETKDDVLQVCQGMLANAERILETGGSEGIMARREFLKRLATAISRIAGVDAALPAKYDRSTLSNWIVATLQKGLSSRTSEEERNRLRSVLQSLNPQGDYREEQAAPAEPVDRTEEQRSQKEEIAEHHGGHSWPVSVLSVALVVLGGMTVFLAIRLKGLNRARPQI
jgi:hypothetical protein